MEDQKRDFFISYTAKDHEWAKWIAWQLEAAGLTTFIQAWDFGAGSDFAEEMNRAALHTQRTIALLSPDYFKSGFGASEWHVAFASDPVGRNRKLIPKGFGRSRSGSQALRARSVNLPQFPRRRPSEHPNRPKESGDADQKDERRMTTDRERKPRVI